ncbi:MAG: type II toxin-antitoxin system VapB family antitoxin [Tepidisphaeraceae bacterium]|jgi:putative antitoxin of VapBC-like toxin-antitoxin system
MKTTIDIPDEMLKKAMKYSKASTKREAVITAVAEYNRRHGQAELIKYLGTFKDFITPEELQRSRAQRESKWRTNGSR